MHGSLWSPKEYAKVILNSPSSSADKSIESTDIAHDEYASLLANSGVHQVANGITMTCVCLGENPSVNKSAVLQGHPQFWQQLSINLYCNSPAEDLAVTSDRQALHQQLVSLLN